MNNKRVTFGKTTTFLVHNTHYSKIDTLIFKYQKIQLKEKSFFEHFPFIPTSFKIIEDLTHSIYNLVTSFITRLKKNNIDDKDIEKCQHDIKNKIIQRKILVDKICN